MADIASYSYLKDFDWSVRLAVSSDKISGLRQPLLIVKLDSRLPDNSIKETLLEFNIEEGKEFLSNLKKIQSVFSFIIFIILYIIFHNDI